MNTVSILLHHFFMTQCSATVLHFLVVVISLQVNISKLCVHFSSLPCMLHASVYLVKSTNCDTLWCVLSSIPNNLLPLMFSCQPVPVPDNCVYALGGFDSTNYQASVERFDPRMGRWCPVPSMSSRRSSCGVAPLDGALYCIGGNDGTMCMSSGERFNIRRNAWEPISSMHSRR